MQQQLNHPDEVFLENKKLRQEIERLQAQLHNRGNSKNNTDAMSENSAPCAHEEAFRLILENMPILLNAFDEHGNFIVWNKACEQSTGYSADEIIGNPKAMEWLYPDPEYRQHVIRMSDDPDANQNTFELTTKSGSKRIITWFDTYQYINIPGWASWGLGLDITERKWAEEELIRAKERAEESDRLKTAFINNISHEIRTPLNSILGFGQFLAEPGLSQKERTENYQYLEKSSQRLLQTITDIMDVSLITAQSINVNTGNIDVISFMNDQLLKTRKRSSAKNILVNLEAPDSSPDLILQSDKELLTKIFDHLISNALKFTKEGRITLGFQQNQDMMNFYVKDTGKGIAPEKQSMIFEAFTQEDISVTRGYEGSGLGLTIAKGLINLLGGSIWLESETGKGSAFYFSLPYIAGQQQTITERAPDTKPRDTKNLLILIAEDDDANYKYTQTVLQMAGYSSLHAQNGAEALELCSQYHEIALVLMDIKMPVMNGLEATKRIKQIRPGLPVIAITAHAQTGDEQKMIAAGCNGYMAKPVSVKKLLETINMHVISNS